MKKDVTAYPFRFLEQFLHEVEDMDGVIERVDTALKNGDRPNADDVHKLLTVVRKAQDRVNGKIYTRE